MRLPVNTVLGHYRIAKFIASGGMGDVYKARHTERKRWVAIKVIRDRPAASPEVVARFKREASLASTLDHPNVCRVYDIDEVDGEHFISMEYVDGEDLASLIRRIGRLPEDKALQRGCPARS